MHHVKRKWFLDTPLRKLSRSCCCTDCSHSTTDTDTDRLMVDNSICCFTQATGQGKSVSCTPLGQEHDSGQGTGDASLIRLYPMYPVNIMGASGEPSHTNHGRHNQRRQSACNGKLDPNEVHCWTYRCSANAQVLLPTHVKAVCTREPTFL